MDAEFFVVIGIGLQDHIAADMPPVGILTDAGILRVFDGIERSGNGDRLTMAIGIVRTHVKVEAERFETMNSVIKLDIADETAHLACIVTAFKHAQGAFRSKVGRGESLAAASTIVEIAIAGRVVDGSVFVPEIRIDGRIVERGSSHSTTVCPALAGE